MFESQYDQDSEYLDNLQDADFFYKELLLKIDALNEEIEDEEWSAEEGAVLIDELARLDAEKQRVERFLGIGEEE